MLKIVKLYSKLKKDLRMSNITYRFVEQLQRIRDLQNVKYCLTKNI